MDGQDANGELQLSSHVESILFVASGPVSISRLARTLAISEGEMRELLQTLERDYAGRGFRLQWHGQSVQLTTAPETGATIERFLGLEVSTRPSPAALEVLAIVAYLQPVTRPQIDEIRGVNSDGALRTLLSKGLIEEIGRKETPGRPILYGTTTDFLQSFGLISVNQLPLLHESPEAEDEA